MHQLESGPEKKDAINSIPFQITIIRRIAGTTGRRIIIRTDKLLNRLHINNLNIGAQVLLEIALQDGRLNLLEKGSLNIQVAYRITLNIVRIHRIISERNFSLADHLGNGRLVAVLVRTVRS